MRKLPAFTKTTLSCALVSEENAFDLGSSETAIAGGLEDMRQTHKGSPPTKGIYFLQENDLFNATTQMQGAGSQEHSLQPPRTFILLHSESSNAKDTRVP